MSIGRGNIPRLDEVGSCEDTTEDDAKAANNEIYDAEEGVASAHNGTGGDENGLLALVVVDREVYKRQR